MKKTNEEFAKTYQPFLTACKEAGVEPTTRQASKYRRGIGEVVKVSSEKWRINAHSIVKI